MKVSVDLGPMRHECFVIMPFETRFNLIYQEVFSLAIEQAGLIPVRADEIFSARRVMQDVWSRIRASRVILAELTGRNANVLYELGLAHAIGKDVVIVTNTMEDVPFDLRDIRCIVYETHHPRWGENLRRRVMKTLRSVVAVSSEPGLLSGIELSERYPVVSAAPIRHAVPVVEVQVAGRWRSHEVWARGEPRRRRTDLLLEQDDDRIVGQARSYGPDFDEPDYVIEQSLIGSLTGRDISLMATNYEPIRTPTGADSLNWTLDSWQGTVEAHDLIVGELVAGEIQRGSFTMRRM